ncbi:MAG TPA: CHAT domain-containing protein, partial [Thermoanaerobaculia bacterium]|nr:CHAT domain-containing protein [Thermoanaerobaculia bacterium]
CSDLAATRSDIKRLLPQDHAVVHYAGHAVAGGGAGGIILLQEHSEVEALTAEEIAGWRLRGAVVVLSSCAGADGRPSPTTGSDGLARAFLTAGARAVIANLWMVNDDDAVDFAARVHDRLATGDSPAAAVRAIQRDMLRMGKPTVAWAGWRVVGADT